MCHWWLIAPRLRNTNIWKDVQWILVDQERKIPSSRFANHGHFQCTIPIFSESQTPLMTSVECVGYFRHQGQWLTHHHSLYECTAIAGSTIFQAMPCRLPLFEPMLNYWHLYSVTNCRQISIKAVRRPNSLTHTRVTKMDYTKWRQHDVGHFSHASMCGHSTSVALP